MTKLSVVVITKNEEANLERCLESVSFAEEIVVIDSRSTDRTAEIAALYRARFITVDWAGFGPAKQTGVEQAAGEWILSLDADEVVSPGLAEEIKDVIQDANSVDGYYIPRRTQFLSRWIYHCGWYPDPVLRLFRKEVGNFDSAAVHEKVVLEGKTGRLHNDLLHYSYPTLESYFEKFNRYTTMAAKEGFRNGRRAGFFDITFRPVGTFIKHYITKRGFLDGLEGFILSILSSG